MSKPDPRSFCEFITAFDCSKVSDGGSAIIFATEEGLNKIGIDKQASAEVVAFAQVQDNITTPPPDPTKLKTCEVAAKRAFERAGINTRDLSLLEVHDCFTIAGLMAIEAAGVVGYGESAGYVKDGKTKANGLVPVNPTGGLIGYGHPVGATGVRQTVDILHQLTGQAGDCQVKIDPKRPYGMLSSMGGNDKTVVAMIFQAM